MYMDVEADEFALCMELLHADRWLNHAIAACLVQSSPVSSNRAGAPTAFSLSEVATALAQPIPAQIGDCRP